jgi:hypothetical protein
MRLTIMLGYLENNLLKALYNYVILNNSVKNMKRNTLIIKTEVVTQLVVK